MTKKEKALEEALKSDDKAKINKAISELESEITKANDLHNLTKDEPKLKTESENLKNKLTEAKTK